MARPRRSIEPISFVTVEKVFQPQVKVRALKCLSGWADRSRRVKWDLPAGRVGCLDQDKAREFEAKGYIQILDGKIKPVSEDEAAEMLSTVTTLSLGAN